MLFLTGTLFSSQIYLFHSDNLITNVVSKVIEINEKENVRDSHRSFLSLYTFATVQFPVVYQFQFTWFSFCQFNKINYPFPFSFCTLFTCFPDYTLSNFQAEIHKGKKNVDRVQRQKNQIWTGAQHRGFPHSWLDSIALQVYQALMPPDLMRICYKYQHIFVYLVINVYILLSWTCHILTRMKISFNGI